MTKVTNVTCFDSQNLLGIASENLLFSWKISSGKQVAYQIQISLQPDFSSLNHDTGWISENNSINILLRNFLPLSTTRYWFRVRIQNESQIVTEWCNPGWFETALLSRQEWKAKWITPEKKDEPVESVNYLLHKFVLEKPVSQARLYASALGIYQLCINHNLLDSQLFSPGWTSYDDHIQYQTWDLTPYLSFGSNDLIISLAEGWYKGELSWLQKRELYGFQKAFIGQLHLTFEDGEQRIIKSDETWRCGTGPIIRSGFYSGEIYDARIDDPEYDSRLYDNWSNTQALPKKYNLVPQVSEPVRVTQVLNPKKLFLDPAGIRLIDLGQNMVGRLRFKALLEKDETITFIHGEVLDSEGRLYTENLRNARQKIVITGNGQSLNYACRFSFQGFRFIAVEGGSSLSDQDLIKAISGEVLHTDMFRTGDFSCDHPLVNQLFENIVWGQRGNFVDIPTDCPQRDERLGWTGDAHIFLRTAASNFNVRRFFRKWLMSVSADQKPDGTVPMVVPDILREYISKIWGDKTYTSSGWGDAAVICPWVLWQMYGDKQLLSEQYPAMKAWVQYIRQTGDEPWLWDTGFQFGDWLALDAEPDSYFGATPVYLVATAFYAWSARLLSQSAKALGLAEDAKQYEAWFQNIARCFRKHFTKEGRMVADTQTAYILPLAFGLLLPEKNQLFADRLNELVTENGYHMSTGFLGTPWLCTVLSSHGHHETALRLVCQTEFPSWLFSVRQGATTVWEHWDGVKPDGSFWSKNMNSFNHYAYGAIGEWLYRYVAGLDCTDNSVAWNKILFRPDLSGKAFRQASAHYDSVRGRVAISWQLTGNLASVILCVPGNTEAIMVLPDSDNLFVSEKSGSGGWELKEDELHMTPGDYQFTITGIFIADKLLTNMAESYS